MNGIIFDIQRFALHDGPGIRTAVFLKGCPLRCVWCHNPESWAFTPQLAYNPERCLDCMACVEACPHNTHHSRNGKHTLEWDSCQSCGSCVGACPHGALKMIGEAFSVARVMDEVIRDAAYYQRSGGGVTLSGGEPLAQFAFAQALLKAARAEGLHTCLDTSGAAQRRKFEAILGDVDLFLYDYKATASVVHQRLTGISNHLILENLDYLYHSGAQIVLRCPLVPGVNDSQDHLAGIAALSARYPRLQGVEIMPYHHWGRDKANRIGRDNPLADLPSADESTKARWLRTLRELGCVQARFG